MPAWLFWPLAIMLLVLGIVVVMTGFWFVSTKMNMM